MAKYKIKWRHIWRNLPMVVLMVRALELEWPTLKEKVRGTQFGLLAEELLDNLVRRRK